MGPFSVGLIVSWYYLLDVAYLQELTVPNTPAFNLSQQPKVLTRRPGIIACSEKNVNCVSSSEDNVIMTVTSGITEEQCQLLCRNEDDCQAYTYYANSNTCHLLRKCSRGQCTHCYSGPKECFCEEPMDPNDGGYWNCNFTPDLDQGWKNQYTACDLICSSRGTSDHIDCKDQNWDPPAENFHCDPEPPETTVPPNDSCNGNHIPYVPNGHWECHDDPDNCHNHCTLTCKVGYIAPDKDTLECNWHWSHPAGCAWCAYDKDTSGEIGSSCSCNGCDWWYDSMSAKDFSCISAGCGSTFPDESSNSDDSWACMAGGHPINPGEPLVEGTECRRRCGQGQVSQGSYKCQGTAWTGQPSICVNDEQELLYFFTTTRESNHYTKTIENPPDSNIISSDGEFTSMSSGLHLFTLVKGMGGIDAMKLKHNDEIIATIPKDDTKTNTISVAVDLVKDDKVNIEGDGGLTFTGVSLYSPIHISNSKCLWGSGIEKLDVQNIDQPIILQDVNDGNGVDYDKNTGKVKIETDGVYMITLNLGSDDSSYASLDINNVKTLGLGEDRDGKNVMSNFLLKEFKAGDTIKPTLEALSNLNYDDSKQTQFTITSLINEVKDWSFCAYSKDYSEFDSLGIVKFDQMFLENNHFNRISGIYTHPYEEFNPKRFYLLSATAFMGKLEGSNSATLQIEQWQQDRYVPLASATTISRMRSMLQVTVIAQMDQLNDKIRVRAEGFMDEGPETVHFTTFCGFRLGG